MHCVIDLRDIIIVGAGPAGSYLGYLLSKKGFDVLNLEEHHEIGRPVECTGVVTKRILNFVKTKSIANRVHGAYVHYGDLEPFHIAKAEETLVIYRDSFDKEASAMSISAGTTVKLGSKVTRISNARDHVEVTYKSPDHVVTESAKVVVGADGANSVVRKEIYHATPRRTVSTYQVDYAMRMEDQDSVSVYVGSRFSKGFFAWAVPTGAISRVGLGSIGTGAGRYIKAVQELIGPGQMLNITGGPIPISYLRTTYTDRSVLVGDAAGIVKPLTGGGIYTGLVSASHAGKVLTDAFEENNFTSRFLSRYQRSWKKDIGRELFVDGLVQRVFASMNDRTMKSMFLLLSDPKMVQTINRIGDIDYPSSLVLRTLIRHPDLFLKFISG